VAEAVGIRRSRLFQLLGTEKLPNAIQEDIRAGRLSEKQSRALQGLSEGQQLALRDVIVADDLPADEAMRLARALRSARLADDREAAGAALTEIRARASCPPAPVETGDDEAAALLSAVAAAATGKRSDRTALLRTADGYALPPFDADRLRSEILALARSLARTPVAELRPGTATNAALVTLYGALDAALGQTG
jgi:ParB family chromosome partitioning protein